MPYEAVLQATFDGNYLTGFGTGSNCYTDDNLTFYSKVAGAVTNEFVDTSGNIIDLYFNATTADQGPITLSGGSYNWMQKPRPSGLAVSMNLTSDVRLLIGTTSLVTTVNTRGVVSVGDGGHGVWYYDPTDTTSTDNIGTIVVTADGKRWKRLYSGAANLKWFGTVGTSDDNTVFQRFLDLAQTATQTVQLFVPNGTYTVNRLNLYANTHLEFESWNAVLQQKVGSAGDWCIAVNCPSGGTSSTANNAKNIRIKNGTLKGNSVARGFEEHTHLLGLSAVTNVIVENCQILEPQGDGIYIGSSLLGATERHNENVTVQNCFFDGINNQNRNGISVIDGTNITIHNNRFDRFTNAGMPSPIDIEPDANAFAIIRGIKITQNYITNSLGSGITLYSNPNATTPNADEFVQGNYISNCAVAGISLVNASIAPGAVAATNNYNTHILNNTINNTVRPIFIEGVKNFKIDGNYFSNCTNSFTLSYQDGIESRDGSITNNTFYKCGTSNSNGMEIRTVTNILIAFNHFIDCGNASGSGGRAIMFNPAGTAQVHTAVRLVSNTFASPTAKTSAATALVAGSTFTNCEEQNNKYLFNTNTIIVHGSSSTTIPTAGSFTSGEYVKKKVYAVVGVSPNAYVVRGWNRITTGSAHVLGVDWAEDRSGLF